MCIQEQGRLLYTSQGQQKVTLSESVYYVVIELKMTERVKQSICIKCCVKLEHSSAETIWMMQKAFRGDAMSTVQIKV